MCIPQEKIVAVTTTLFRISYGGSAIHQILNAIVYSREGKRPEWYISRNRVNPRRQADRLQLFLECRSNINVVIPNHGAPWRNLFEISMILMTHAREIFNSLLHRVSSLTETVRQNSTNRWVRTRVI